MYERMEVEMDTKKNVAVKSFVDPQQNTSGMVDLLSNLDNL